MIYIRLPHLPLRQVARDDRKKGRDSCLVSNEQAQGKISNGVMGVSNAGCWMRRLDDLVEGASRGHGLP